MSRIHKKEVFDWEGLYDVLDFVWEALASIASILTEDGSTDYSKLHGKWEVRITFIPDEEDNN